MANKLNDMIRGIYDQPKGGEDVELIDESQKEDLKPEVISVDKNKSSIFSRFGKRISDYFKDNKVDVKYLLLAIPIIAAFLITYFAQSRQTIGSQASTHQASLSFQLASWSLPPQNTFGVWVNSDSPVGFADIEITFDPKLVKLTQEVSLTNSLTRKIKVTSMADANSTGKISVIVGLDPANKTKPPSGAFQIAGLTFNSSTSTVNAATAIKYDTAVMQMVAMDQSVFSLTAAGLDLTINPPSATPNPTMTATPTPKPGATFTPTPVPTAPPKTATPAPSRQPTPAPVVNPGETLLLTGSISDSSDNFKQLTAVNIVVKNTSGKVVGNVQTKGDSHYGFYLPSGTYKVSAYKWGFNTQNKNIDLNQNSILNFDMPSWGSWSNWHWWW